MKYKKELTLYVGDPKKPIFFYLSKTELGSFLSKMLI